MEQNKPLTAEELYNQWCDRFSIHKAYREQESWDKACMIDFGVEYATLKTQQLTADIKERDDYIEKLTDLFAANKKSFQQDLIQLTAENERLQNVCSEYKRQLIHNTKVCLDNSDRLDELKAENERLREAQRWISVDERLPEDELRVLCLHIDSGSHFICNRTKDCLTNKPKWYGGAMPTHWKPLSDLPELTPNQ